MTVLTWRKEPPDSEGVWAYSEDGVNVASVTTFRPGLCWSGYFWCRIGDVPEIKPAVKYRPVRKGDEGCEIQVGGNGGRYFVGFSRDGFVVYEYEIFDQAYAASPELCRIIDDGQAKQARELFVNEYEPGRLSGSCFLDLEKAKSVAGLNLIRTVKFREVTE